MYLRLAIEIFPLILKNTNGACQTPNCSLPGVLYCTGCRCFVNHIFLSFCLLAQLCQDHNITIHSLLPSAVLEQHKRIAKQTEVESATNSPFQIPESARVCQIHSGEPRTVACMTCKELPILCKYTSTYSSYYPSKGIALFLLTKATLQLLYWNPSKSLVCCYHLLFSYIT